MTFRLHRRRSRSFAQDRAGATALEFAILALPFIMTMLAIAEYGYVYLINVSLDNAVAAAARQIRTGQMQTSSAPSGQTKQQQFQTLVCKNMTWVSDCGSALRAAAEVETNWANQSSTAPTANGALKPTLPFNMGQDGDIVLVHAYYPWKMITPNLWINSPKLGGNSVLLSAASIVVNEPYSTVAP